MRNLVIIFCKYGSDKKRNKLFTDMFKFRKMSFRNKKLVQQKINSIYESYTLKFEFKLLKNSEEKKSFVVVVILFFFF